LCVGSRPPGAAGPMHRPSTRPLRGEGRPRAGTGSRRSSSSHGPPAPASPDSVRFPHPSLTFPAPAASPHHDVLVHMGCRCHARKRPAGQQSPCCGSPVAYEHRQGLRRGFGGPFPGKPQVAADESGCRPGSVPGGLAARRVAAIHLGLPLPTASCGLPADSGGQPSNVRAGGVSLRRPLDLAPGGVYLAAQVALGTGGLLHHRFTLTGDRGPRRSVFCGTVPRVTPGGR
jgi:hypothetical protein